MENTGHNTERQRKGGEREKENTNYQIRSEWGHDYIDTKRIIRKDDEQVYVNTFDKFDGMVKFLEKHDLDVVVKFRPKKMRGSTSDVDGQGIKTGEVNIPSDG